MRFGYSTAAVVKVRGLTILCNVWSTCGGVGLWLEMTLIIAVQCSTCKSVALNSYIRTKVCQQCCTDPPFSGLLLSVIKGLCKLQLYCKWQIHLQSEHLPDYGKCLGSLSCPCCVWEGDDTSELPVCLLFESLQLATSARNPSQSIVSLLLNGYPIAY